jgi:CBS domain-containing protein
MFHVFGIGGRLASGGADTLPVNPVRRIERLDTVHAFMADEKPGEAAEDHAPRNMLAREAVTAYAEAGHPATLRVPHVTLAEAVMTREVVTVQADATLVEAARWLAGQRVGQAPVIDEHQRIVGLIGRGQILAGAAEPQSPVRGHMVSPVPAATPDTDVRLVARLLLDTGLPGIPVVDGEGALCGFVARGDLLQVLAEEATLDTWT